MLRISTRSTLQTTNDGHPMWGTSLCLRWQSIRVSEHHHPWLHLEEEESKHCIPLCKGRCCQRWMTNSIRQHSWKWGRPADEHFAVRRQEKRFCMTRTPPYLRPMGKEQVRCNKTTNGLGLKCLNHLDEVDSFLTNHTRFILIFGFWFWILVLVFGFFWQEGGNHVGWTFLMTLWWRQVANLRYDLLLERSVLMDSTVHQYALWPLWMRWIAVKDTLKQLQYSTWTEVLTFFRATYEPTVVLYATCTYRPWEP